MPKEIYAKAESFYVDFERKTGPDKISTHYCPGCGHGNLHKMIAETLDEFGVRDKTIFVWPVGCSVFGYYYFHTGNVQVAHGRAPAVATGIKRAHPDSIVLVYQGDGDLAGIGGNEILQAANRGENITVFFVNNAIYGMTGGQMAPTTLPGMKTTTTPLGRTRENEGLPIRVVELLSALEAPTYLERVSLTDAKQMNRARRAVRKAIQAQVEGKGFTLVEALAPCPTGWKIAPTDSRDWIHEQMEPLFPLGAKKDVLEHVESIPGEPRPFVADGMGEKLDILASSVTQARKGTLKEEDYANPRIKVAGFGGQGILLLGVAFSECGMQAGYEVSWLPSYGPEMRGGTANCHVRISDPKIGSPMVEESDVLIAMNRPSLEKFEPDVRPGGLLLLDSSLIDIEPQRDDVTILKIPATKIADDIGTTKCANMVMMGAYIERTGILDLESVIEALPSYIKRKKTIPMNQQAIAKGAEYVREHF
ncbi:MAG: 2-ketoisovalerate ferredoxin oxidoreductase [Candidatus Eisenbacteria bacterium]|nr:2-ketoisovalerate ferredoxin oxidoreductase [Candidatus Latescibacterota bacterium]MBD3303281.1 2-ketoisovalerate ferredoxin oxidoreductase [Candidatus Eisenbacteria bacterium]